MNPPKRIHCLDPRRSPHSPHTRRLVAHIKILRVFILKLYYLYKVTYKYGWHTGLVTGLYPTPSPRSSGADSPDFAHTATQ